MTITQDTLSTTKRIEYIDALRGFTMFLVVFMHVADWCLNVNGSTVEYSFHRYLGLVRMPMFFLISGFVLYKEGVTWDIAYIIKFFKKKIPVQLIGPFIFFAAYVCVNGYNLKDSIFDGPKYGYWFTYVLFEYFVFYAIVRFFVRSWWADVVLLLMGACFYTFSWPPIMDAIPIPNHILEFFSFKHWHYFIFFVLGTSATVRPLPAYEGIELDIAMVVLGSALVWIFVSSNRRHAIKRWAGAVLLLVYALYLTYRLMVV